MEEPAAELVVPEISQELFEAMTTSEKSLYLKLYREQVSPKFEEWRNPHRVKCATGGRGAGAKSRSAGSLLIQFGENPRYFGKSIRVLCCRDVQKSIKESSWRLLRDELERLKYTGWEVTQNEIRNNKNGSYFVFNGLNDLSSDNLKSYESFDILFVEEGAHISLDAWVTMLATFRKEGSEIWCLFNRDKQRDPCFELFCENPDPSWSIIFCRPGRLDNPWWDLTTLQKDWDMLKRIDPDKAVHEFEGLPSPQGSRSVFSISQVMAMKEREVETAGAIEIGCDVARFGKDKTIAWKRKGSRIIERRAVNGFSTGEVVGMLIEMTNNDKTVPIKVDVGYNPGVVDMLYDLGMYVVPIGFGERANDENAFVNAAAEMMFELPVDNISVPAEYMTRELVEDLTERMYGYDTKSGRRKLEPKDGTTISEEGIVRNNFKARHGGRSPDEGDAFCLCFYERNGGGCY